MKCQSCGKKEANVRYYENINGKQKEILLCSDCAQNLGFAEFSNFFSPIFTSIPKYIDDSESKTKCETCGYSFDDYTKTGLFGCPDCYNSFKDRLDILFLKLHGKNRHIPIEEIKNEKTKTRLKSKSTTTGKKPENELEQLKEALKKLVDNEEYEEAAIIRDKIKKLEK